MSDEPPDLQPLPDDPVAYAAAIRGEIPRYEELQDAAVAAIPGSPGSVLELGIGTAETTRRLLAAHPGAVVTGLDASPQMVFAAREIVSEVRLARMEDPLPDGPWDLVISVLSVHLLTAEQKRTLCRRLRDQASAVVIGDVVAADPQTAPVHPGIDFLTSADELAEMCGGEVVWTADDLAVVRAVYG